MDPARLVVAFRVPLIVAIAVLTVALGRHLAEFRIDAGANALLLEDDPDLRFYDETRLDFGSDEYLLVALERDDLFSADTIAFVESLRRRFAEIRGVQSATAYTNVPLLRTQPLPIPVPRTLAQGADPQRARAELVDHEVFGGFLVSRDGRAANIVVTLAAPEETPALQRRLWMLDRELARAPDDAALREERARVQARFDALEAQRKADRVRVVGEARRILGDYPGERFYQSGVPIINVDMVRFIEQDLRVFGALAAAFFIVVLAVVFRRVRWVLLPLATCLTTVVWTLSWMVLDGKKTTVVTSNISSLLFILGMEHSLHLVERYREIRRRRANLGHREAVAETLRQLWAPALFTATTTIAGFVSLLISGIRPVIDFGTYMAIGVGISLLLSFTLFPAGLALLGALPVPPPREEGRSPFGTLARITIRYRWAVAALSLLVLAFSVWGIARLEFETRFVDYFAQDTEISRGLHFIDRELGGTTSLEIVLESEQPGYFATAQGLRQLGEIMARLRRIPEIGHIVSLHSVVAELRKSFPRADEERLFAFANRFPEVQALVRSYATEDFRRVRIFARLRETSPTLRRNAVLAEIRDFLAQREDLKPLAPRLTGVFLLYANLLNSLIGSQVKTFGLALAGIVAMLAVLFRSVRIALIGILPNALPILFVLGFMGLAGIHLDMMTVTIASVSLGIAVDGTIHYVFRHRREWMRDGSYEGAVVRAHDSVGRPVLWTSVSVMVAFCVLALSAFRPTRYFGILTAMAMAGALFGSLTVLPVCLLLFRPYGRTPPAAPAPQEWLGR